MTRRRRSRIPLTCSRSRLKVGANVARDWERRTWVLIGISGHGFKFGAVVGEAIAAALSGQRSAAATAA